MSGTAKSYQDRTHAKWRSNAFPLPSATSESDVAGPAAPVRNPNVDVASGIACSFASTSIVES